MATILFLPVPDSGTFYIEICELFPEGYYANTEITILMQSRFLKHGSLGLNMLNGNLPLI
jgi:hypothetical protein